jgi:predicted permease
MRWVRSWLRRSKLERDLARELDTHLDIHVNHLIASGLSPEEGRRRARMELGGVDQVKEQVREARAGAWLDQLMHDGRDAFRGLKRTPAVTATAVVLIALVVGGNTSIYSMVHAVLTKPAAGVQGDGLVTLEQLIDGRPVGAEQSYPDFLDYARSTTLTSMLASQFQRFALTIDEGSYAMRGGLVSDRYFETLGVRLVRGRTFMKSESGLASGPGLVAVVSERVWQTQFRGAEDVIGRSITLNGHPATIAGVAPPQFHGAWLAEMADVWVPLVAYHRVHGTAGKLTDRAFAPMQVIGRLAPGVTLSQARVELATIAGRLQTAFPETNRRRSVGVVAYSLTAGGNSIVATQGSNFLAVFSIVTALTLAIVCANVANLMLGRAVLRQRELALRQTLGASRARILRTLIAEGIMIALAAWLAACIFALAMSKGVIHFFPQNDQGATLLLDLTPDWRVIAYAFALALGGTVAFTIGPAVRAWQQELLPSLKSGELGVVAGRSTLSGALVIVQLGFAVLLLTSAGLAYRSLYMLASMDPGFRKENLVLVNVETTEAATTTETHLALLDRLSERLRAVPGVQSVSYLRPNWGAQPVRTDASQQPLMATTLSVGPGYFAVLGMTPLAGREFSNRQTGRAAQEVLITQHLAESLWPGESPIGRTLQLGMRREPVEIVGEVPNGVFSRLQRETRASYVFRLVQPEPLPRGDMTFTFYVRHAGALDSIAPAIGRAVREVDTRVLITYLRTMEAELDDLASGVRIITIWITLFSIGSLVIAAIGQYAVIAFDMRRRTRDFGVRIALGASYQQILGAVIAQGLRWTGVGLAIGFALSLAAGVALRGLLVGVTPTDGPTYLGVFTLLAGASLVACYLPARRAARIDPIQALREE